VARGTAVSAPCYPPSHALVAALDAHALSPAQRRLYHNPRDGFGRMRRLQERRAGIIDGAG
jgi:hypothetical protein